MLAVVAFVCVAVAFPAPASVSPQKYSSLFDAGEVIYTELVSNLTNECAVYRSNVKYAIEKAMSDWAAAEENRKRTLEVKAQEYRNSYNKFAGKDKYFSTGGMTLKQEQAIAELNLEYLKIRQAIGDPLPKPTTADAGPFMVKLLLRRPDLVGKLVQHAARVKAWNTTPFTEREFRIVYPTSNVTFSNTTDHIFESVRAGLTDILARVGFPESRPRGSIDDAFCTFVAAARPVRAFIPDLQLFLNVYNNSGGGFV